MHWYCPSVKTNCGAVCCSTTTILIECPTNWNWSRGSQVVEVAVIPLPLDTSSDCQLLVCDCGCAVLCFAWPPSASRSEERVEKRRWSLGVSSRALPLPSLSTRTAFLLYKLIWVAGRTKTGCDNTHTVQRRGGVKHDNWFAYNGPSVGVVIWKNATAIEVSAISTSKCASVCAQAID